MSTLLRAYCFPAGTALSGELVGALERMDDASAVRDAVVVRRDPQTGDVEALDLGTGRADGTVSALLDFRLDPDRRRELSTRTLDTPGGIDRAVADAIAATLEPGAAFVAFLVDAEAADDVDRAATGAGGRAVADEPVDATTLAELGPSLRAQS